MNILTYPIKSQPTSDDLWIGIGASVFYESSASYSWRKKKKGRVGASREINSAENSAIVGKFFRFSCTYKRVSLMMRDVGAVIKSSRDTRASRVVYFYKISSTRPRRFEILRLIYVQRKYYRHLLQSNDIESSTLQRGRVMHNRKCHIFRAWDNKASVLEKRNNRRSRMMNVFLKL